jgi:hypothetical protein
LYNLPDSKIFIDQGPGEGSGGGPGGGEVTDPPFELPAGVMPTPITTAERVDISTSVKDYFENSYWNEAYISVTPETSGVYKLELLTEFDGENRPQFRTIKPCSGDMAFLLSNSGFDGNTKYYSWQYCRLQAGETYNFQVLIPKSGLDTSNGIWMTLKANQEENCKLTSQVTVDQGMAMGSIKGFYGLTKTDGDGVTTENQAVTINVKAEDKTVTGANISLEAASTATLAESTAIQSATVETNVADVTFDHTALETIADVKDSLSLTVSTQDADDGLTVSLNLNAQDSGTAALPESTSETNGSITVSVPYAEPAEGKTLVVDYVRDDGSTEAVDAEYDSGTVAFHTTHFSDYRIREIDLCTTHTWGNWETVQPATCTAVGQKTHTCSVCRISETEEIPKLEHSYTTLVSKPTCTKKGYTIHVCVVCGDSYWSNATAVTEHPYQETARVEPTLLSQGLVTYKCASCGTEKTEILPALEGQAKQFQDVQESDWYADAVAFVSSKKLMEGYGDDSFRPTAELTRSMMMQILYNAEGCPQVTENSLFTDVADDSWYSDAVTWAAENGIVKGYGDGRFGPDDNITREQMVVFLYRYAEEKGCDVSQQADLTDYTDGAAISNWAGDAMSWAVAEGLIQGMGDGTLNPCGTATRAQVATILMRFYAKVA